MSGGPVDPILRSRRYVLGEWDDGYAIWDRRDPSQPVETFVGDEDLFDAAHGRFRALRREARVDALRSRAPRLLLWAIAIGLAGWLAAGILLALPGWSWLPEGAFTAAWVLNGLGYQLALGGLVGTIALAVTDPSRPAGARRPAIQRTPVDTALWWAMAIGMIAWIAGALAESLVAPLPFPGPFAGPGITPAVRVAELVSSLGYKVWVSAAVILGFRVFGGLAGRLPA